MGENNDKDFFHTQLPFNFKKKIMSLFYFNHLRVSSSEKTGILSGLDLDLGIWIFKARFLNSRTIET